MHNHQQIARLECSLPINCFVSHVVSPGEIWMKPMNHISEALIVGTPPRSASIRIPENPFDLVSGYVMAPWEEDLYARARISAIVQYQEKIFADVLFIDKGKSAMVSVEVLREMDSSFFYHPWQTLVVAMFGCEPLRNDHLSSLLNDVEGPQIWDPAVTQELRRLLDEFPLVRVEAICDSDSNSNSSGDIIRGFLWGVSNVNLKEQAQLLNPLFAFRCRDLVKYGRDFVSAKDQKIFDSFRAEEEESCQIELMPTWRVDKRPTQY